MRGKLMWLLRALLVCSLVSIAFGCGDDDGDEGPGDSGDGDSGDGDSGDGDGGDGDSGDGDGGDGDSGDGDTGGSSMLTKAECLDMSAQSVSADCLDCACELDPDATARCNEDCWGVLTCLVDNCDGDYSDGGCISQHCSEFTDADGMMTGAIGAMAMVLGPSYIICLDSCAGEIEGDGGTEDAGE